jgi:hypothetical protein
MKDMHAKDLFRKLAEADEPGRPLRRLPPRMGGHAGFPGAHEDDPQDITHMTGREFAPKNQFTSKELSQLKDILIMILAKLMDSDLDMEIGQALMSGQELNSGQLQHILDETRGLQVPASHGPLLQKISKQLQPAS